MKFGIHNAHLHIHAEIHAHLHSLTRCWIYIFKKKGIYDYFLHSSYCQSAPTIIPDDLLHEKNRLDLFDASVSDM